MRVDLPFKQSSAAQPRKDEVYFAGETFCTGGRWACVPKLSLPFSKTTTAQSRKITDFKQNCDANLKAQRVEGTWRDRGRQGFSNLSPVRRYSCISERPGKSASLTRTKIKVKEICNSRFSQLAEWLKVGHRLSPGRARPAAPARRTCCSPRHYLR